MLKLKMYLNLQHFGRRGGKGFELLMQLCHRFSITSAFHFLLLQVWTRVIGFWTWLEDHKKVCEFVMSQGVGFVQYPLVSGNTTLGLLIRLPAAAPWCWRTNLKVNSVLGDEKLVGQSMVLILEWHQHAYFDEFWRYSWKSRALRIFELVFEQSLKF